MFSRLLGQAREFGHVWWLHDRNDANSQQAASPRTIVMRDDEARHPGAGEEASVDAQDGRPQSPLPADLDTISEALVSPTTGMFKGYGSQVNNEELEYLQARCTAGSSKSKRVTFLSLGGSVQKPGSSPEAGPPRLPTAASKIKIERKSSTNTLPSDSITSSEERAEKARQAAAEIADAAARLDHNHTSAWELNCAACRASSARDADS